MSYTVIGTPEAITDHLMSYTRTGSPVRVFEVIALDDNTVTVEPMAIMEGTGEYEPWDYS